MKLVFWTLAALVIVLATLFAVSNRTVVATGLWPFSVVVQLPLYLVVLIAAATGFVVGEIATWIKGRRRRRDLRALRRRIDTLERELAATQAQLEKSSVAPVATSRPVLLTERA